MEFRTSKNKWRPRPTAVHECALEPAGSAKYTEVDFLAAVGEADIDDDVTNSHYLSEDYLFIRSKVYQKAKYRNNKTKGRKRIQELLDNLRYTGGGYNTEDNFIDDSIPVGSSCLLFENILPPNKELKYGGFYVNRRRPLELKDVNPESSSDESDSEQQPPTNKTKKAGKTVIEDSSDEDEAVDESAQLNKTNADICKSIAKNANTAKPTTSALTSAVPAASATTADGKAPAPAAAASVNGTASKPAVNRKRAADAVAAKAQPQQVNGSTAAKKPKVNKKTKTPDASLKTMAFAGDVPKSPHLSTSAKKPNANQTLAAKLKRRSLNDTQHRAAQQHKQLIAPEFEHMLKQMGQPAEAQAFIQAAQIIMSQQAAAVLNAQQSPQRLQSPTKPSGSGQPQQQQSPLKASGSGVQQQQQQSAVKTISQVQQQLQQAAAAASASNSAAVTTANATTPEEPPAARMTGRAPTMKGKGISSAPPASSGIKRQSVVKALSSEARSAYNDFLTISKQAHNRLPGSGRPRWTDQMKSAICRVLARIESDGLSKQLTRQLKEQMTVSLGVKWESVKSHLTPEDMDQAKKLCAHSRQSVGNTNCTPATTTAQQQPSTTPKPVMTAAAGAQDDDDDDIAIIAFAKPTVARTPATAPKPTTTNASAATANAHNATPNTTAVSAAAPRQLVQSSPAAAAAAGAQQAGATPTAAVAMSVFDKLEPHAQREITQFKTRLHCEPSWRKNKRVHWTPELRSVLQTAVARCRQRGLNKTQVSIFKDELAFVLGTTKQSLYKNVFNMQQPLNRLSAATVQQPATSVATFVGSLPAPVSAAGAGSTAAAGANPKPPASINNTQPKAPVVSLSQPKEQQQQQANVFAAGPQPIDTEMPQPQRAHTNQNPVSAVRQQPLTQQNPTRPSQCVDKLKQDVDRLATQPQLLDAASKQIASGTLPQSVHGSVCSLFASLVLEYQTNQEQYRHEFASCAAFVAVFVFDKARHILQPLAPTGTTVDCRTILQTLKEPVQREMPHLTSTLSEAMDVAARYEQAERAKAQQQQVDDVVNQVMLATKHESRKRQMDDVVSSVVQAGRAQQQPTTTAVAGSSRPANNQVNVVSRAQVQPQQQAHTQQQSGRPHVKQEQQQIPGSRPSQVQQQQLNRTTPQQQPQQQQTASSRPSQQQQPCRTTPQQQQPQPPASRPVQQPQQPSRPPVQPQQQQQPVFAKPSDYQVTDEVWAALGLGARTTHDEARRGIQELQQLLHGTNSSQAQASPVSTSTQPTPKRQQPAPSPTYAAQFGTTPTASKQHQMPRAHSSSQFAGTPAAVASVSSQPLQRTASNTSVHTFNTTPVRNTASASRSPASSTQSLVSGSPTAQQVAGQFRQQQPMQLQSQQQQRPVQQQQQRQRTPPERQPSFHLQPHMQQQISDVELLGMHQRQQQQPAQQQHQPIPQQKPQNQQLAAQQQQQQIQQQLQLQQQQRQIYEQQQQYLNYMYGNQR